MRDLGIWTFLAIVALVANLGCRDPREITDATGDMLVVVEGNNEYAVDLYGTVAGDGGNLFFSPFSITAGTSMMYAGAEGETEAQIADALHVETGEDAWHANLGALFGDLSGEHHRAYTLYSANAVWGQDDIDFRESFLDTMEDDYAAPLQPVDFEDDPDVAHEINRWVSDETKGHVEELFRDDDINSDTRLVLANAIYFEADWYEKFRVDDTVDGDFTLPDGSKATVPLMKIDVEDDDEATLGYAEYRQVQILEMDYEDQELSMVVVLPRDPWGLPAVEASLTAERLQDWIDGVETRLVSVTFPSFELDYELPLEDSMRALGIVDAFDMVDADFTGFVPRDEMMMNWYLGAARHKAYVKVDEQGTEAAAATGLAFQDYGVGPRIPSFVADHPFLFVIRDKLTGAILFMGRIEDPRG